MTTSGDALALCTRAELVLDGPVSIAGTSAAFERLRVTTPKLTGAATHASR